MKRLKDLFFTAIVIIGGILFFMSGSAPVTANSGVSGREPEVVAATFSSSWCSACKILKPKLAKVIPDFESKPIEFIEFDYTLGRPKEYRKVAIEYGFGDAYDRYEGGTGFTLLIDRETGEVIDMLTMSFSKSAMRAAIAQAITVSSES